MSAAQIETFRQLEEECRREAEKAISQPEKEAWLQVAEWRKLAEKAERRAGKHK